MKKHLLFAGAVLCGLPLAAAAAAALPEPARAPFEKGLAAVRQQEWSLAARYFEEARAAAPDAADVHYNQGLAEARIGGRELRAIALLRATIAAEPASPRKKAIEGEIQSLEVKSEAALQKLGQQARELASKLPADQQAYAYADVARSQARAGDLQGARATAELLSGNDRQRAYGGIVSGLLDAGDLARAKDLMSYTLDYASERARLVELQSKTGDLVGAQGSLHYVREEDRPAVSLVIAKAMAAGGKTAESKKLFAEARAATLKQKFILTNGLNSALAGIVVAQAEAGDIEGAIETAARLEADPHDGKCEGSIYSCSPRDRARWAIAHGRINRARALASKKDFAGARRDAEQVPADVFVAAGGAEDYDSRSLRDEAWQAIRSGAADDYWMGYRNDRAALRKVVEGLPPESRQSTDVLSATSLEELPEQLVGLDLDARDFVAARSVIALAGTVPMRVRLAGRVAEGLAKAGKVAEAREVVSAAKTDALAMRESRKVPALGKSRVDKARLSWVRGAAAAGMMAQAEEALPLLDEAGRKDAQEAITAGWVASGDVTRALAAIERTAAGYGRDSALGNLAKKLIATGDLAGAERVVAKAEGADSTKHELSKAHADRGDFVTAARIASGITDKDYKRWAENHRIEKQISAQLAEPDRSAVRATVEDAMARAEATATAVEDPMLRSASLRTVAGKWRDLRRREDALRVDRLAALATGTIADGCERAGAQLEVAKALEADGDVVGSHEAWESVRADASACANHHAIWAAIALGKRDERGAREVLARHADADAALKAMADLAIARTPPDVQSAKRLLALVGVDGQRIYSLAYRQAQTGDFTGAVATMKTMPPADTWNGFGWKYVCIEMMRAGKHAEAKAQVLALTGGVRAEVLPCLGSGPDADWAFEQARALPERSKLMKEIAIARVEKDAAGAQRMLAAVETSGTPEHAREVAIALAGAGHVEAAVRLGPPTVDPQWYWKQLAEGHAKRGRAVDARAALKKVNATPRAVADLLLRHGLAQEARKELDALCPPVQAECAGFADGFVALHTPANWPATPAELARITDAGTKEFMLRATIAGAVGKGDFPRAAEWAAAAPEQDRAGVLAPVVTAALAAQKAPLVKSAVEKLPEGPARGWLLLDIARVTAGPQQALILAAARKGAGGSPVLTAAIDDAAQRAKRPAPETALLAVVAGRKGNAATTSSKGDEARQQRVQEWGYLVDSTRNGMLSKPVFTDFAAHLQSIANKPTAREVVSEFCSAMDAISQAREAIAELAKKQRTS